MKKLNFDKILKDKITGGEMGKFLIKNFISELTEGEENNPISHGEFKKILSNLHGQYNIDTYNKHYHLLHFFTFQGVNVNDYRAQMEILLWKISFLLTYVSSNRPLEVEDLKGLTMMIYKTSEFIKQFLFLQAIVNMAVEFTKMEELYYFLRSFPKQLIETVNKLIELSGEDLPVIEIYIPSAENIKKALEEVKDLSDLYDTDKMRQLLGVTEITEYPAHSPKPKGGRNNEKSKS